MLWIGHILVTRLYFGTWTWWSIAPDLPMATFLTPGNVPWSVGTSCAKDVQLHRADPAATADIQSSKTSVFKGKIITKTLHLLLGNF